MTSNKTIPGKERECCLKAEEIAAAIACKAKSSMDRKNFENFDLKVKLAALKSRKKNLSIYSQL